MSISQKKFHSGGFVFAEFAIALPLLILLMYGLARISINIFQLGKEQLAEYGLETEVHSVLESIKQEARVARKINIETYNDKFDKITMVYHTVADENLSIADIWQDRVYIPHRKQETGIVNLYRKRKDDGSYLNTITGENGFGNTQINSIKYEKHGKFLHISLEVESLNTGKKIKLNTAVFMPAYEN